MGIYWPGPYSLADTALKRFSDDRMTISDRWNAESVRYDSDRKWISDNFEYSAVYARALVAAHGAVRD